MARARYSKGYVEGAEELVKLFEEMSDVANDIMDEAVEKAAKFVLNDAKQRVPVRTGKLKNSLDIRPEKNRKKGKRGFQVYSKGVTKGGVRYAFAVENGTSKMAARPFLRPAIDKNRGKINQIITSEITKGLGRVK